MDTEQTQTLGQNDSEKNQKKNFNIFSKKFIFAFFWAREGLLGPQKGSKNGPNFFFVFFFVLRMTYFFKKFHFCFFLGPGPTLDPSLGPKNENWAKQKKRPPDISTKMSETQKKWVKMLLGTGTAAPNFHFKLHEIPPKKRKMDPQQRWGGWVKNFFRQKPCQ